MPKDIAQFKSCAHRSITKKSNFAIGTLNADEGSRAADSVSPPTSSSYHRRCLPSTHLIFIYCTNTPRLYGAICLMYTSQALYTHKSWQRGWTLNCSNDDAKALFISGPNASDTGNIYLAGGGGGGVDLNCSDSCNTSRSFATPGFLPCNLVFPFLISIFFFLRLRK